MDSISIKVGLMDSSVCRLKGGPLVFMGRLKESMMAIGIYNRTEFNKWINLSFKKIPKEVLRKQDNVEIIIRFDGIYNISIMPSKFNFFSLKSIFDFIFFKYMNKKIVRNYLIGDKIIYQSYFSKFHIEKLLLERFGVKLEPKQTQIIYNGIDINKFRPMEELRDKKSFPNILVSHRMLPYKRAHQIPLIISILKNYYPNLKVHVLGKGVKNPFYLKEDSLDKFKREVREQKLDSYFNFYGYVEPDKLPMFYNKCDFMLNLSYADPCPNVVIEAMACGLPVVAPNSGGIPELVGREDMLVKEDVDVEKLYPMYAYEDLPQVNPEQYVERIKYTVDNLTALSRYVRNRTVINFNIDKVVQEYISFICEEAEL